MPAFLISRLSALGDTVCTLPVAAALRAGFPDAHISWAVDPRFAGIVECCTAVDEVIRVKPSIRSLPRFDRSFDVALEMQGLLKSAVCVGRAKANRKVGYHWQREGAALFSERILPDSSSFHIVDQYVDVARAVGGEMDRAEFALVPRTEDVAAVREKLSAASVADNFVLVNAGAGWASKRWPPNSFATVIDAMAERGVRSVLIGGKADADREAAASVTEAAKHKPANLLGQTSVRELVALTSLAAAHVGGDTGSSHLAAALGVPAVGLYAITRPQRSCPYGQIDRCFHQPEGLHAIPPEPVAERLLAILEGNG